jgi:4-hydroxy-tetrahydrodipicolinate synthase
LEWSANGGLHGIGNSLYTPFSGPDGDDIDYEAYRALVRHCVGTLGHPMLWLTGGLAEWWALTLDERKTLVEVAIDEARAVAPDTVIQVATSASSAKECVELTQHAQASGADLCYLQTPTAEVHAGEGVLRFYKYVAERTDIALGIFNTPSSGYVLTPAEIFQIAQEVPAVCVVKEGVGEHWRSRAIHSLAPHLVIWETDPIVYRAGWLQAGIVGPAQIGIAGYLRETPQKRYLTEYWTRIWDGRLAEAIEYARDSGLDKLNAEIGSWFNVYPGRPDYFTHWGGAFRYAASVIGLPVGDYPHSRAPQGLLPDTAKTRIRTALENAGLADQFVKE